MKLYRFEIPECPFDDDGDGDCAFCSRDPEFHRKLVEVPTAEVPWCRIHDAEALPWDSNPDIYDECWRGIWTTTPDACRIEDEPSVFRIAAK